MMQILILIFLCVSCSSEVKFEDLKQVSTNNTGALQTLNFNPQIEMMMMFLWPKDLNLSQEKEVIKIISTSRKISTDKNKYLENLSNLDNAYSAKACDCHLYDLCEDDMEMDLEISESCDEIVLKMEENDQILADLILDHDKIKESLKSIGATNIDIGVDDEFLDIGIFDLETRNIHLNKFGYLDSSEPLDFKLNINKSETSFEFKHKEITFFGSLGISIMDNNIVFSGDIETSTGLRGLIYWEHLK